MPWLSRPPQEREKELSRIESQLRDARSSGESEDQLASRERARSEVASSLDQKKGEREQNLKRQQQTLEARFRNFFKVRATSAPPHLVGRFPDDTPLAHPPPPSAHWLLHTVSDCAHRHPMHPPTLFVPQDASADAIDLMIGLLHFEPHKRLTAEEALQHRYIQQFHDPAAERIAERKVLPSIDDDDKKSTAFYRDQLYRQISDRRNSSKSGYGYGGGADSGRSYGGDSRR